MAGPWTPDRPGTARPRSGGVRGSWTVLCAARYRQLADDDDRAAYWVRHVRLGVVFTEVAALAVVGYVLLTPGTAGRRVVLLAVAGIAVLAAPLLPVAPVARMVRGPRGSLLFTAGASRSPGWSPWAPAWTAGPTARSSRCCPSPWAS